MIQVRIRDAPNRSIALVANDQYALIFKCTPNQREGEQWGSGAAAGGAGGGQGGGDQAPRYQVEFSAQPDVDLRDYKAHGLTRQVYGTLGLITIERDVFVCVVQAAQERVATVRPGETVQRILSVEFHCLSSSSYDYLLNEQVNSYPTDHIDGEGYDTSMDPNNLRQEVQGQHPCLALKKILSSGTFYYSADFDLTRRLQKRITDDEGTIAMDSLDAGFLWNSFMIQPLVDFRSRLGHRERAALDASRILTSAIRGFCASFIIDSHRSPLRGNEKGPPGFLTLISRLSCRRAGTRFNARGIDDDGNVANFVETETTFWDQGVVFSYTQVRGSIPIFWEQATGLLPNQQKITITRSPEATQPAFDKHFENMEHSYGAVHVVNLLSKEKQGEIDLSQRYHHHIKHSALNRGDKHPNDDHNLLKETQYDFHAETRGPGGYVAAEQIRYHIQDSAEGFAYFLAEEIEEKGKYRVIPILQQEGVFRTNCLDCLDRTNLVQTIISKTAMDTFLEHRGVQADSMFWSKHSGLWADNGDHLSRIYAGTGALKSSFTRHGKMSLGGILADARKSATRVYINNFTDKARQDTIDLLLGRQMGQMPVHLYDPINDYVQSQLKTRAAEYTTTDIIRIFVGTFNLNGKTRGLHEDLTAWLCPDVDQSQQGPEIVAVGFQEIVELSPQQIMSTDPARRQHWEQAVKRCLNENAAARGDEDYVILRGGQLVGASLSVFVKSSVLRSIKNVEGAIKKTGLSGIAGNKGAVAIRMEFANTSICFVTAHLAAGFANYEERNRDYKTISEGLRFQRNRTIDDHDSVIWLGDFNYRIGLSDDHVRKLIEIRDLESLYDNDQLRLQMGRGYAFPFYDEARITFNPTYKYDVGTTRYDSSEKQRIPAWCDRVLRKGQNLKQLNYSDAPLMLSDHRPVYANFLCQISMVDEKHKEELNETLYVQRKANIGRGSLIDDDDEPVNGSEKYQDSKRWWLNGGMPAKTTIQPPGNNYVPNPDRSINPFAPADVEEWVQVKKPSPGPPLPPSARSNRPASTASSRVPPQPPVARRSMAPPLKPDNTFVPTLPPRRSTADLDAHPNLPPELPRRSPSQASIQSLPVRLSQSSTSAIDPSNPTANVQRKQAPPRIPKKPVSLTATPTGSSIATTSSLAPQRSLLDDDEPYAGSADPAAVAPPLPNASKPSFPAANATPPVLPQPRRSMAAPNGGRNGSAAVQAGRRGPMDDLLAHGDGDMEGLRDWEVLRPG